MQYLRRRISSEAIERNVAAVEDLPDRSPTVADLAGRIDDAVLVELLRPAIQVDDAVQIPREHYDTVVDELHAGRRRIEAYERAPLGLVAVGKSRLYRRGYRRPDAGTIDSVEEAGERYAETRRREMTALSGLVAGSLFSGTAAILAGGVLSSVPLLGLGIALLVGMIPAAVAIWQYFRGRKDRLLDARYEREAATLVDEVGACTIRVLPPEERPPTTP